MFLGLVCGIEVVSSFFFNGEAFVKTFRSFDTDNQAEQNFNTNYVQGI